MNRRVFLTTGVTAIAAAAHGGGQGAASAPSPRSPNPPASDKPAAGPDTGNPAAIPRHPREIKLHVKPVMANVIHSHPWQGPCRWVSATSEVEKASADQHFARWSQQLKTQGLGRPEDVHLLEPVHITFSENWVVTPEQFAKLDPDRDQTDVFFMYPAGNSRSSFEIGARFGKPIVLAGLGCRNTDIACYTLAKGNEVYVSGDDLDLTRLLALLRARKVFRQTRVLYPTNGVPPFTCGNVWDFAALQERLGVTVIRIPYREMAEEMNRLLGDPAAGRQAAQMADQLQRRADKSVIEPNLVVRNVLFDFCIRNLMARHGCNAFTIDCFEFCNSKLPQQWLITPCLLHARFGNEGIASSCEADFGSLLAVRLLISVSNKSPHQGNGDPVGKDDFCINHSAPSMKMNGLDEPDLPYQLGRFVQQGWGTKVVIDFMNNTEKTVTVARVDPTATRLLVLRGTLVGASGWGRDLLGCSVEAVIRVPDGRRDEFLRRRLIYGNHLQWVYGDYTRPLKTLGEMLGLEVEVFA